LIQAHESWEKNVGPFLAGPGVKAYQFVEIVFGGAMFFLDVKMVDQNSKDISWSRYIFTDLSDLVRIFREQAFEEVEITALHRYVDKDSHEYEALAIVEISLSSTKNCVSRLKYRCSNGDTYSAFAGWDREAKKGMKRTLYRRKDT
jgi:hypothetical protein